MTPEEIAVLPESIRDWDEVKTSDTPEKFWDRIKNIRSKVGTGVYKPSEDAGDEGWKKFSEKVVALSDGRLIPRPDLEDEGQRDALYRALGKPKKVDEYVFVDDADDIVPNSDAHRDLLGGAAFRANLTKDQLKIIDIDLRKSAKTQLDESISKLDSADRDLRTEWGMTYTDRVNEAKKIAQTFFPHLGDNVNLSADEVKSFFSLAKQLNGNGTEFHQQQQNRGSDHVTPDDAAMKIAEIRSNKDHPYHDVQSAGHAAAKKKMRQLYLTKNGLPLDK